MMIGIEVFLLWSVKQGQKAEWSELGKLDNDFLKYFDTELSKMAIEEKRPGKRL